MRFVSAGWRGVRLGMGEWKAQVSIRVRQALRAELEEYAARERRKLGNISEVLLEWSFEQLKVAGSTRRLMKFKISPPGGKGSGE